MCHVIKLWTNFQKTKQQGVSTRGTGFSKGATLCPLDFGGPKKYRFKPGLKRFLLSMDVMFVLVYTATVLSFLWLNLLWSTW